MKSKKSARKYAASGKLKQAIQARHQHKQMKKKIEGRKARKSKGKRPDVGNRDEGAEDDAMEEESVPKKSHKGAKLIDDEDSEDEKLNDDASDEEDFDDEEPLESLEDMSDEEEGMTHALELSKLKEKDPEFYKYLEENDKELLDFDPAEAMEGVALSDDEMVGQDSDDDAVPALTIQILKTWQKALLEHRSLRALRKLLLAFRSAAYANDEDATVTWAINDASLFDKVINTCLKYTPVVLDHHIPYRTLPNGKYKPPIQSSKQQKLSKLVLSFYSTVLHLLSQLTEPRLVIACLGGSAKLVPYISGNRKAMKAYLKTCLGLWASPGITGDQSDEEGEDSRSAEEDKVRLAAFLSMRRAAKSSDEGVLELVLKGSYMTLLRNSKSTNPHTLPSITLMKNTAVDLYCIDQPASYQLAFGYIRQLAVSVRNALKGGAKPKQHKDKENEVIKQKKKSDEPYKQVYNWQFVHAVDFWSMLLSRACTDDAEDNELRPLIYPLVQVALGAIKLIPTARYYPFHVHMLQPLQTLSHHTHTYIPLAPHLLSILLSLSSTKATKVPSGSNSKSHSAANSTLKPLLLATHIRTPTAYLKSRVFVDGMMDEALFLLLQWAAQLQASIAFPEVIIPVLVGLKRSLKVAKQTKGHEKTVQSLKTVIERLEEGRNWTLEKRKGVGFAPGDRSAVDQWQEKMMRSVEKNETPVGKYTSVLERKRNREQAVLERARLGQGEILEED